MMQLRTLRLPVLGALLALGATSCLNAPDYSDTPEISMNRVEYTVEFDQDRQVDFDSFNIIVDFKDGDGDLGLTSDETNPPYSRFQADGVTPNRFYNNYFVQIFRRNGRGEWEPFIADPANPSNNYDGRYPLLNPDGRKQPLRGDLSYKAIRFARGFLPSGSTYRFEITIADRNLNESNTVTSEPVTIK
ncbi:hypothetical protein [Hymenobacter weizhouensis]|uniref:hypothetical protein n=1 Tax=Hymenobacter sp. YIM 151500-1 TaxID=2987689 RepID=UPI00222747CF|nr:hypothetical protein [Hymenobacter sp. YIM 151500-1]UYZ64623.1 hypothetical protein OIS53_07175 [Hymenobacter sp. YIM 151500-1]